MYNIPHFLTGDEKEMQDYELLRNVLEAVYFKVVTNYWTGMVDL
jgi:hypothetical protein